MAVRSIVVTKEIIKKLIDFDINNLTLERLKGLEVLNGYNFNSFRKYELDLILNSFSKLFKETRLLDCISDEQKFFLNLSCTLTEFDVITVLDYEGENIVFNIEVKKIAKEENEKVINQIKKRVESIIPTLYPKTNIISLGFSEEFVYGISQIDKNEIHYTSLSDINIKLNDNLYVDQSILSIDKIDAIHKLYVQAEDNTLKYYQDIKDRYADILKEIKSGTELIIVDGCAGSGKTALSFKLYFKSDLDINFLIMNEKFYYALGMEKHFKKSNFITYGTDFLVSNTDEQIVVIDEAQRLNKERLIEIMEKSPCVIWLGDFTQSFSIKENVESVEDLKEIAEQLNKTTKVFKLKKSKRYPNAVERAINYLVGINTNKDSLYKLLEYEINIYTNEKQFYEDLIRKKGKMFTPNHFAFKEENKEIKINGEKFIKAERDYVSFPINTNEYSYYGYTLNAYSFDVRHNFIYLYDLCIDKKNGFIIPKDKESNSLSYKEKFQNELYTLFTRGKESLNIFVQDIDVYLHLNKNLRIIKNASKIE